MELSVKLEGRVLEKLKNAPETTKNEIRKGVLDASTLLLEQSVRNAPSSTGTLRKSMRRDIATGGLRATIFPSVDYAFGLHGDGTKPRSNPFFIPSREAREGGSLYRWAKKKGMNPWAVRASIARKGIKHNPWLFETSQQNEGKVKDIFVSVVNRIARSLTT